MHRPPCCMRVQGWMDSTGCRSPPATEVSRGWLVPLCKHTFNRLPFPNAFEFGDDPYRS